MKKSILEKTVAAIKNDTKTALQTVYNALSQTQQKKMVKNEQVKALFDRYGVEYANE